MVDRILEYISIFLALIIVLPLHEFAHGFAAVKSGDFTPKLYKRYTLNPFAHFDILGLCCFVIAGFGRAKPMPVNPNNFKHYKRGFFFVSVAGVIANYVLAFLVFPLSILAFRLYVSALVSESFLIYFAQVLAYTLSYIVSLSLVFFVFNLIPVYPLDGFRVIDVFCKKRGKFYRFLREQGIYVLYFLILLSFLSDITNIWQLDILGITIGKIASFIEYPIILFWGLIF